MTLDERIVLEECARQIRLKGFAPTTRELQKQLGFASQTSVVRALAGLESKQKIRRVPRCPRTIVIL